LAIKYTRNDPRDIVRATRMHTGGAASRSRYIISRTNPRFSRFLLVGTLIAIWLLILMQGIQDRRAAARADRSETFKGIVVNKLVVSNPEAASAFTLEVEVRRAATTEIVTVYVDERAWEQYALGDPVRVTLEPERAPAQEKNPPDDPPSD